jgi:signal transduction histidine kinase
VDASLSLQSAVIAIASLVAFCVVSGFMTAVLAQQQRDRVNLLFAAFSLSLLLWSLAALLGPLRVLRFGMPDYVRIYLLSTGIALSAVSCLLFTAHFVHDTTRLTRILERAAPLGLLIGLIVIWSGAAFVQIDAENYALTPLGYLAVGAVIGCAVAALRLVVVSEDKRAQPLRVPMFVLMLAYLSLLTAPLRGTPLAILLAAGAAARIGWVVLRFQWFDPLRDLREEMRVLNRDLRQTVTELAAERAKTENLTRQLQAASQIKSEFLDKLGQKLRTPLNSIAGFSELLLSGIYGDLTDKQRDRIRKINRNGQELLELISDMLDLNRIEAGRMNLQYSPVLLRAVFDQALARLEARRAEKPLPIIFDLPSDLPPLYADHARVCQVFTKLLDNALKFTFQGAITVRAAHVRVDQGKSKQFKLPVIGWLADGEWIITQIIDTGIGIPPEEQAKIFDEFYQVSGDDRLAELSGAGLGLTVARKLVEAQEGTIWVKSVPEQGSTFFVALRVHPNARALNTSSSTEPAAITPA